NLNRKSGFAKASTRQVRLRQSYDPTGQASLKLRPDRGAKFLPEPGAGPKRMAAFDSPKDAHGIFKVRNFCHYG
ncbi:MAG: hypothetical protein V1897_12160, partial [Pseudomonadota bacterium]